MSNVIADDRDELLDPFDASPGHRLLGLAMAEPTTARALPRAVCLGWGVGALTMAMMSNVFNLLVLRFATDFLGIAAGVAGLLLALSKLYDAVADPVIGTISDNWREGIFTGLFARVEKAFSAAGVAAVGGFIGRMGYISSKANAVAQQPAGTVWAVAMAFAVVPFVMALAGATAVGFYRLKRTQLAQAERGDER